MAEKPPYDQLAQRIRELEMANFARQDSKSLDGCVAESEDRCRHVLESLSELICRFKPDGSITFVNDAFCRCFDRPRERLIGSSFCELIPAQDQAMYKEHISAFTPENSFAAIEYRTVAPNGTTRWHQWNDCAVFDSKGKVVEFQSVGRDVTDKKRAEAALRKSESKCRSIMDAMEDAAYICSPGGRIEYMNQAMVEKIGHDATGERCHEVLYGRDEKCPWCVFDKIEQGEHVEHELVSPLDNRYYSVSNTPICYSEGVVSKLTILRDLSELKTVQEQLRQSQKMESLARLAGGIAHDFNNILAGINGYTELLMDQIPTDSGARENLDQILFAGQRAKQLIRQIVQFIRPDKSNEIVLDPIPVVTDVLSFMRSSLPATIDIRKKFSSTRKIEIDKEQLSRVVMNLCTNAHHAMEDTGGILQVSLADADLCSDEMIDYANLAPGPYVKLKASDSGHGMDAQTAKMVFDPYFSTKDKSKGSGLGLSIVHGIVSTCKGAVRVESQPGQGTTFQVLFPAAAVSQPGLQDLQEDKRIWGRGECFLFIDDEPMLANLGRKRLENLGYKVVAETNPIAALRRFREQPDAFSLVITDMTMPQMTGEKLAKELVAIRPDIPIIICTGYNHRIDEKTAKTIGVKAFLTKPIAIDLLAEVVNRALKGE